MRKAPMPTNHPIWLRPKLDPTPADVEARSQKIINQPTPDGTITQTPTGPQATCHWCNTTLKPSIICHARGENTTTQTQNILNDHLFHTHGIHPKNKKASA